MLSHPFAITYFGNNTPAPACAEHLRDAEQAKQTNGNNNSTSKNSTKEYYCYLANKIVKGCVDSAIIDNTKFANKLPCWLPFSRRGAVANIKAHKCEHKLGRIPIHMLQSSAWVCASNDTVVVRKQFSWWQWCIIICDYGLHVFACAVLRFHSTYFHTLFSSIA